MAMTNTGGNFYLGGILRGIGKVHPTPPPRAGIGDEDSTPKIIDHFVRGFLDQTAATPVSHLHNVLVQNFDLVVNKCSVAKVGWLQAALAADRGDIADALYASGIYCDGDGVYFRGTQSFSARPADVLFDNGSSLWKAISSEFLLAADYLAARGARSFAPRTWEPYAATGTEAMRHLISAYGRLERRIKFRVQSEANGMEDLLGSKMTELAELECCRRLIHCIAHCRKDLFHAVDSCWVGDAVREVRETKGGLSLVRMLLKLGAPPDGRKHHLRRRSSEGKTQSIGKALMLACTGLSNLELVKLLCAYGADSTNAYDAIQAHIEAMQRAHNQGLQTIDEEKVLRLNEIKRFLIRSKQYTTPLHFTEVLSTGEVHSFLDRGDEGCRALWVGADAGTAGITPMECAYFNAYALVHKGLPVPPGLRRMILLSQPFSPQMMPFLPPSERRRVRELLLACALVSKRTTPALPSLPFQEIWMETIFPLLVDGERGRVAFDQAGALARLVDAHGDFQTFCS